MRIGECVCTVAGGAMQVSNNKSHIINWPNKNAALHWCIHKSRGRTPFSLHISTMRSINTITRIQLPGLHK